MTTLYDLNEGEEGVILKIKGRGQFRQRATGLFFMIPDARRPTPDASYSTITFITTFLTCEFSPSFSPGRCTSVGKKIKKFDGEAL